MADHPVPVKSYHSEEWYSVENSVVLERKTSTAASLTQAIMLGPHPHHRSSGISLHEETNFAQESLDDMYLEDLIASGRKEKKHGQENIRATLGFWKLIWFDLKFWYRRYKLKNQESRLFKRYIKTMESNFGSAIGSLFVFTRWILVLNFALSILWLGFVVVPTAIHFPYEKITKSFALKNILDGKGLIAQSWLFIGCYTDKLPGGYHTGLAYLAMLLFTYFGSLYIILGSITQTQEQTTASTLSSRYRFALMMWTSWDHTITSKEASINLSKGITSAFKFAIILMEKRDLAALLCLSSWCLMIVVWLFLAAPSDNLYEAKASQDVKERSRKEKIKVYFLRAVAWLITIILIGGGCTAIVYLVLYMNFSEVLPNKGSGEGSDFISVYGTTVTFSLINFSVPSCIRLLPKMEKYASGRDELNITLTRIFFLRMANLFALITSLYNTITESTVGCAGTVIGQELYKLVILDTILHSCMQLMIQFAKSFWTRQKNEFNISSAVLVLIYRQALIWVGTLACPIMPVLGVMSDLVFFYVNYTVISGTCKPPIKRWNQSRNTSFFSLFLLGSLALLIPPISIVIGSAELVNLGQTAIEGQFCGPFGNDKPTRAVYKFGQDQPMWLKDILRWIFAEPVLLPIFFILLCVAIHQRSQIGNDKTQQTMLQAELQQEREENEKLIKKLQDMGIGVDRK